MAGRDSVYVRHPTGIAVVNTVSVHLGQTPALPHTGCVSVKLVYPPSCSFLLCKMRIIIVTTLSC